MADMMMQAHNAMQAAEGPAASRASGDPQYGQRRHQERPGRAAGRAQAVRASGPTWRRRSRANGSHGAFCCELASVISNDV